MSLRQFKLGLMSAFALLVLLPWQNCSDVSFTTQRDTASAKGQEINDFDEDGLPDYIDDEDSDGVDDESELARRCFARLPGENIEATSVTGAQDVSIQGHRGALSIGAAGILNLNDIRGSVTIAQALDATLINLRGPLSIKADLLRELSDLRGPLDADVRSAMRVYNTRGPICLNLMEQGGALSDIRGPIRVFGRVSESGRASIQSLINHRGPIFLENVRLERLSNHRGPIFLKNSEIGVIEDHRGPVIQQ